MIKKYLEFIKESQLSLWPMEEVMKPVVEEKTYRIEDDKIEELFVELQDEGYTFEIDRGYVEQKWFYGGGTKEVFGKKLIKGKVTPAYLIDIYDTKPTSVDVTDVVLTAVDYFEDLGFEVELLEGDSKIDLNELLVKGGFFLKDESGDITKDIQIDDVISIFVKDKKEVDISAEELCEYYEWISDKNKDTFIEGNDIYIIEEMEDLADTLIRDSKNSYKEQLVNGIDGDYYWSSEYRPSTNSLFQYDLDKDNEILTIRALIKEYGGLEEFLKEADNDNLEGLTEDEVINFLLKESYHRTLEKLCEDSELINDIKQMYGDHAVTAHQDENYKDLVNEFDNIVGDRTYGAELSYSKFDKEVEVKHTYTKEDGTRETRSYPAVKTFYKIKYENKWIEDFDYDFLKDYSLDAIFREYVGNIGPFSFEPHFSDYGTVDSKSFNSDVTYMLNHILGIKNPS